MAEHNDRGNRAEEIARRYLVDKGYGLLHCNWRAGRAELDIVAEHDNLLIIVEVKGRLGRYYDNPTDVLPVWKMKHLVNAAEAYVHRYDLEKELRFDLVVVIFEPCGHRVEHVEEVFVPGVNW